MTELFENNIGNDAALLSWYIKSVSAMLSLVSSVRESDNEQHFPAENILICKSFASNHQNCTRYGAFQHIFQERKQSDITN